MVTKRFDNIPPCLGDANSSEGFRFAQIFLETTIIYEIVYNQEGNEGAFNVYQ